MRGSEENGQKVQFLPKEKKKEQNEQKVFITEPLDLKSEIKSRNKVTFQT